MKNYDTNIAERIDYETFISIIGNIPSCIFFKDTELKYQFSSHYWIQLTGDDIIGKTDIDIRKDTQNAIEAMEADREIIRSKKGTQYTIKCDIDGEVSYLELIKEPLISADGEVLGIVGLINDITAKTIMEKKIVGMSEMLELQCRELEASNEELRSTLEKVERMHEAQKLFTASMNHELRSPLNGILGNLQLIMDDDNLTKTQRESISGALQSSQLMLEIVNELLDFAKYEMKGFSFKHEPFSIEEILDNIENLTKNQAGAKGLIFRVNKAATLPPILVGDESKIRQILLNLTSNAVKYTERGSISLSALYEDGKLILSCSDTGQGIAPESIKCLFDPYVRLQEKRNSGIQGTGLGLSVTKKLVEGMNGEITVSSKFNEGSIFTARIPLEIGEGESSLSSPTKEIGKPGIDAFDFTGLKVLCVDDSKVNATIMANLLQNSGIHTDIACSAKEGIEKADITKYDIIFMDHLMPETDGIEAFSIIRKYSLKNAKTPVIILTGNSDASFAELYRKHGFAGHLVKPILKDHVLEAIASILS